jgi:hypothetical protein
LRLRLAPVDLGNAWGLDPTFFDFGPRTTEIVEVIRRARRLTPQEVRQFSEEDPGPKPVAETLARLKPAQSQTIHLAIQLAIGHWASSPLLRFVLLTAVAEASKPEVLSPEAHAAAVRFKSGTTSSPGITRWDAVPGWEPPIGHPVPLRSDVDFGPNRRPFVWFYQRSGHLSGSEVGSLINEFRARRLGADRMQQRQFASWDVDELDLEASRSSWDRARRARPTALAVARLLGHMARHHGNVVRRTAVKPG